MKARWLLACVLLCIAGTAVAEEVLVAAAADLNQVLPQVAARFERATGNSVKLSFGSSGNFFSQIQNGAPFDVFLSADVDYPKRLDSAGLIEPGTLYEYALGKLVLWVPKDSNIDVSKGLQTLLDLAVRHVAIANPAHAPYGRAAKSALQHDGLWDKLTAKVVVGENISQTFELVHSGNADAGIVALSLVEAPKVKGSGRFYEIPTNAYPPLRQAAAIMKTSSHKAAAKAFLDFLKRPEIVGLMKQYGFEMPNGK